MNVSLLTEAELRSEVQRLAHVDNITPAEDQRLSDCLAALDARDAKRSAARAAGTDWAPGHDAPAVIRSRSDREVFAAEARSASESVDLAKRAIDVVARHGEPIADLPGIVERHPGFAERMRALANPNYGTGFLKIAAAGGDASRALLAMTDDERAAFHAVAAAEARAMSLTDANGGYGVPLLLDPSIVLTNTGRSGSIRSVSRVVRGVSDVYRAITSAGSTASWDAEATEVSDDSPTLANLDVTAHSGRVFVPVSDQLFDDYVGLAEQMRAVLADARDRLEAAAFITGSGSGQPAGIVTRLDANTNVEVVTTTDGAFGTVDVYKVFAELPARHRPNATWLMSLDVQNEIRAFGDDKLGNMTVDLTSDYQFRLLGRPVIESASMPTFTGTTGAANILVVGDFQNYLIFDRLEGRLEVIPHLFGTTNGRPTGQRGWFYSFRTGADVLNQDAFRLLQNQ